MTTGSRAEHILTAPERLDLDMRATRHMDSAGLRALILVRRRAASGGTVIGLRGASAEIQAIFSLTKTEGLFEMEAPEPA